MGLVVLRGALIIARGYRIVNLINQKFRRFKYVLLIIVEFLLMIVCLLSVGILGRVKI